MPRLKRHFVRRSRSVEITRMPGTASATRFNARGASMRRWTHFATPCDMTLPVPLPIAISELCSSRWTAMPKRSAALRHALALDPGYALAHGNLGALLARSGCPVAAESASRTAIALAPDQHRWLTNLGVALFSQGRHAEAEECYRKALTMQPDYASGHGNLLFALNYRPDITAEAIFAEYQDWDRRHAKHLGIGQLRHSRWIGHQGGDCGSDTYRRISGNTRWRCSPNRCSPRMIGQTSNSISMRASRPRTPPPNASVRSAITGAARSACATRSWPS